MATEKRMMLHLNRAKKGQEFMLTLPSTNGKCIFSTETFTQKQSAWKNVAAAMKFFGSKTILVQDNSIKGEEPVVLKVSLSAGKLKTVVTNLLPKI
jgi:uncharacterized protein YegP (UPF0339 family)